MANIPFIPECRKVIQGMRNRTVLTPDGDFYSEKTIRNTELVLNNLEKYFETLGGNITMNEIDFEFTEKYRLWLMDCGLAKNTVSHYMARFRFWIRRFHKYGMMKYSGPESELRRKSRRPSSTR